MDYIMIINCCYLCIYIYIYTHTYMYIYEYMCIRLLEHLGLHLRGDAPDDVEGAEEADYFEPVS